MLKLCVAVLARTTAAQGSFDPFDFSQLGCIRAVPEDIALVEFSLENSTLLSNNLGGQGGKHPIDYEDPHEIRFAQVVTVTRKPSVEMKQASSPVALRAAPPRRRPRSRGLLLTLLRAARGRCTKSRASGTTMPGIRTDRMCHSRQKR